MNNKNNQKSDTSYKKKEVLGIIYYVGFTFINKLITQQPRGD
jgi:hypothetical protein